MTKTEYINELRNRIAHLPADEREAALTYYIEYLDEIGEANIDEAIRELGTPKEVAERIIEDFAQRSRENGERRRVFQDSGNGCLIALLAALTSPIWIPLGIAVFCVIAVLVAVVILVGLILLVCAILPLAIGIWALFQALGTGLFLLGVGLVFFGVFLFALTGSISLFQFVRKKRRENKYRKYGYRQYKPSGAYTGYQESPRREDPQWREAGPDSSPVRPDPSDLNEKKDGPPEY